MAGIMENQLEKNMEHQHGNCAYKGLPGFLEKGGRRRGEKLE